MSTTEVFPARGTLALNRMIEDALVKIAVAVDAWCARVPAAQAEAERSITDHPSYTMHAIDSALLVHALSVAAELSSKGERAGVWAEVRNVIEDELIARLFALDPENPF